MDPRVARTRETVLAAAVSLLTEQGVSGLTHQTLAARSGLSRATLYRRWPSITQLLLDLLDTFRMPDFVNDGKSVEERVRSNLAIQSRHFGDPRYMSVYLAVQSVARDPEVAPRLREINRSRVESVAAAFAPEYDLTGETRHVVHVLALMNGPLLQLASFVDGTEPPAEVVDAVVTSVTSYLEAHCRVRQSR